jgi:arylsulfatase
VHEGGISTPLIVRWPRGIQTPGALRHNPGHVIDLVPTILDAAGIDRVASWHGRPVPDPPGKSLLPAFSADHSVAHDCLWWLHEDNRAIRVGDWKLVADNQQQQWELYDLSQDRSESINLADKFPEKVQELSQLWEDRWREFRALATHDEQ